MRTTQVALLALLAGCGPSQDQFDALQARVDEQAEDIDANDEAISALRADVAVLDSRVDALEQTLANAAGGDLVALGDAIAAVAADLDTVEAAITGLQGGLTTAQTDIDTVESGVASLQTDMAEAQSDITDLQGQSGGGALADDVQDLADRVDALELRAGNDAWTHSGTCGCNISSGSDWTALTGAVLTVTLDKPGPLLLVASNSAGSADGYFRLKVTRVTGGAWSTTTPEVKIETGVTTGVASLVDVVTVPSADTYQIGLEARGTSNNYTHTITAVQLTEAP